MIHELAVNKNELHKKRMNSLTTQKPVIHALYKISLSVCHAVTWI